MYAVSLLKRHGRIDSVPARQLTFSVELKKQALKGEASHGRLRSDSAAGLGI